MPKGFWYWFFRIWIGTNRFLWHWVLRLKNGAKGKVVSSVTNPLLLKSATKLAQEIRDGKLKSEEVVQVYIDRILEVEPIINATVERCFEDALKEARKVDFLIALPSYSKEHLIKEKPLLGVPFSIKIAIKAEGMHCTAGYKAFEHQISPEDAPVVALMKKAGAILLTTTNVPELLCNIASVNKLHGTTCNPYDTNRTSGGSSGGESALIAAGGSVLGLGNDLLGSLRIPAHFTGIFSHKPSMDLVPNGGSFPPERPGHPVDPTIEVVYKYAASGPMCRYAEDLIVSMKILSSTSGTSLDFDTRVDFKKTKLFYLKEIRSPMVIPVDKEITNGLEKAVSYFEEKYNTTAQELKMPSLYDAHRCVWNLMFGHVDSIKEGFLCGEELGFGLKTDFLKAFVGKSVLCFSTLAVFNLSHFPLWYKRHMIAHYQKMLEDWAAEFSDILDENSVLLMPTSPVVAPYHSEVLFVSASTSYTSIFSVLGLPATQCPLGLTEQGLPMGIQIVGRKNNDALTVACAVELEKAFGGWRSPGEIKNSSK